MLDLNATVDRLRASTPGNRFEIVDFRSEGGGGGSVAVTSSSDVVQLSTSSRRDEEDDEEDDVVAAIERAQLDNSEPTVASHAWDMTESSPC